MFCLNGVYIFRVFRKCCVIFHYLCFEEKKSYFLTLFKKTANICEHISDTYSDITIEICLSII